MNQIVSGGVNIYKELIQQNFNIQVTSIKNIADHSQSKAFLVISESANYVLKEVNSNFLNHPENEGELTEYLYNNGINIARIIRTKRGQFVFSKGEKQFHLQEYINGEIIDLNTAPDWFLKKSAQVLGQIQHSLSGYIKLPLMFDKDFFDESTIARTKQAILTNLKHAEEENNVSLIDDLSERLKHVEKISCFEFDLNKLTRSNSHGDFYVNQIIVRDQELTIIDWTSACYIPVCFEVIMSYTYADPACKDGTINIERFKSYLNEYIMYFPLSDYDLKMMPYFYYYQLGTCNFMAPYDELPNDYLQIAKLCDNIMNWLYINVDDLSRELSTI